MSILYTTASMIPKNTTYDKIMILFGMFSIFEDLNSEDEFYKELKSLKDTHEEETLVYLKSQYSYYRNKMISSAMLAENIACKRNEQTNILNTHKNFSDNLIEKYEKIMAINLESMVRIQAAIDATN